MKRVVELPEASRETLDNFYVLNEDGAVYYTKQVDETTFVWSMVSTSNLYCHNLKIEFSIEILVGVNLTGTLYIRFYNSDKNPITGKTAALTALIRYGTGGPITGSAFVQYNEYKYAFIAESISWEGILSNWQINLRGVSPDTGYGIRKYTISSNSITEFHDTVIS